MMAFGAVLVLRHQGESANNTEQSHRAWNRRAHGRKSPGVRSEVMPAMILYRIMAVPAQVAHLYRTESAPRLSRRFRQQRPERRSAAQPDAAGGGNGTNRNRKRSESEDGRGRYLRSRATWKPIKQIAWPSPPSAPSRTAGERRR